MAQINEIIKAVKENEHYNLPILKVICEADQGLTYDEIEDKVEKKIGKSRQRYYESLGVLLNLGLIAKETKARKVRYSKLDLGKIVLRKIRSEESQKSSPCLVDEEFLFHVGKEGKCNTTLFLPFGSVSTKHRIAYEMSVPIERLAETLLEKSYPILEEKERLQAWILIDLDVDAVDEDVMLFRDDLLDLRDRMDAIDGMWIKQREELPRNKKYYVHSNHVFEAALLKEELKNKGVNVTSLPQYIEAKWSALPNEVKEQIEQRGGVTYTPDFRFSIDNKIEDLSDSLAVQGFLSWLKELRVQEWVRWNLKKNDEWFDDIPWDELSLLVDCYPLESDEDEDFEFVDSDDPDEDPRYLFCWKGLNPMINQHLRILFHMLKRVPMDIGLKLFFDEINNWVRKLEGFKKLKIETDLSEDVSSFIFLNTYDKAEQELDDSNLPKDLREDFETFLQTEEHANWTAMELDIYPLPKKIIQMIREGRPSPNHLIDDFIRRTKKDWKVSKSEKKSLEEFHVIEELNQIGTEYFRLIEDGMKPKEALKKAITKTQSPSPDKYPDIHKPLY